MKKVRNSNIEILRIIAMIMIVVSHWTVHNGVIKGTIELGFNRLLLEWAMLGNIGVVIYVMITGFFLGKSDKPFSLKKILKLWLQVLFYSVVIYVLFVILGKEQFSYGTLLKCFMPITTKEYWFITAYFVLMILTPFINKFINSINKDEFTKLLKILTLLFILLPTLSIILIIASNTFLQVKIDFYGTELIQFVYFYLVGAYLSKYEIPILKHSVVILIISILVLLVSPIIFINLSKFKPELVYYTNFFFNRNSMISVLISVCLLTGFCKRKEFSNKVINYIAGTMFAVYLISDNNYVRKIIWTDLLCVYKYVLSKYLIVNLFLSVLIIFSVCIVIEIIRKNTIERLTNRVLDKLVKE